MEVSPKHGSLVDRINTSEFMLKQPPKLLRLLNAKVDTHCLCWNPESFEAKKQRKMGRSTMETRQGWAEHTLASMSPPASPLVAIFAIIFLLVYSSTSVTYKNQLQNTVGNFKLFLLFLPVLLVLIAQFVHNCESLFFPNAKEQYGLDNRSRDMPWRILLLVVVLLLLVSYQSSFQAMWSPIVRRFN